MRFPRKEFSRFDPLNLSLRNWVKGPRSAAFTPLPVLRAGPPQTQPNALDPRTLMRRKRRAPPPALRRPDVRSCPQRFMGRGEANTAPRTRPPDLDAA